MQEAPHSAPQHQADEPGPSGHGPQTPDAGEVAARVAHRATKQNAATHAPMTSCLGTLYTWVRALWFSHGPCPPDHHVRPVRNRRGPDGIGPAGTDPARREDSRGHTATHNQPVGMS